MKICCRCKKEKELEEFTRNTAKKDGYSHCCRECKRIYDNVRYHTDPVTAVQVRGWSTRRRAENRAFVDSYLSSHPCVDCGNTDIDVLEFDHISNKIKGIAQMVLAGDSLEKLQAEIDKCQVRCANCHKKRHANLRRSLIAQMDRQQLPLKQ